MIVNDLAFGVCFRVMEGVAMPKMAPHYLAMIVKLPGLWCLLEKHGGRSDAQDGAHYLDIIVNDLAFGVCLRSMGAVAMPKMAPTTWT